MTMAIYCCLMPGRLCFEQNRIVNATMVYDGDGDKKLLSRQCFRRYNCIANKEHMHMMIQLTSSAVS